jgi:Tol biopolymer transport system component
VASTPPIAPGREPSLGDRCRGGIIGEPRSLRPGPDARISSLPARVGIALALVASSCTGGAGQTTPSPSRIVHPTRPGQGQLSASPAAVDLPGLVAYSTASGDIWVMNGDGSDRRRVTDAGGHDFDPSLSPDGERIVFRTSRGDSLPDLSGTGVEGIFVVGRGGSGERQIQPPAGGLFPDWSPQGDRIALSSLRPDGTEGIFTMDPDGRHVVDTGVVGGECSEWSPDGLQIAYCHRPAVGSFDVWVMDADGSHRRRLTDALGNDHPGPWSPDGRQIAFSSQREGTFDVFVMNADGTGQHRLTVGPDQESPAAWLPDGRIVYASFHGDEALPTWYVMKADGSDVRAISQLAGLAAPIDLVVPTIRLHGRLAFSYEHDHNVDVYVMDLPAGTLHRLTTSPGADFSPTWSPDGRHIAFRSDREGNDEVFVMNADGSGQRDLTNDPSSDYSPAWSPRGDVIAFATSRADPSGNDVWLMDPDGSRPRPLVEQTGIDEYPTWSPDGSRVAFGCTLGKILASGVGDFEICVVNADGRGLRRITDAPGISAAAGWSPDGSLIVFSSNRDQDPGDVCPCGDLYVVHPDGTGLARLTEGAPRDSASSWGSDGHVFFSSDRRNAGGETDLWVMNPDGTATTLLSPFPGEKQDGVFFPTPGDGR